MPEINPDDPCPCDSGQRARGCCLFGGTVLVREADTRPKAPATGYAHPRCYAAALNDCCEKISGEHAISEGVLEELAGRAVWIRGFPWQKLLFVDAQRRVERSVCFTWAKGLEGGQVTLGWGTPPKG